MNRRTLLLGGLSLSAVAASRVRAQEAELDGGLTKVTPALSAYIAGSQTAAIPDVIRELARLHILDTLAAIVACRDLAPAQVARTFAAAQGGGGRQKSATILGTHQRAGIVDAAFASAMTAHSAEINDFIPSAFVQPGPAVVSVALALAEARGRSGEAILRAVVAGYELAGRIPKALGNDNLRKAGIANHGVGAVFGAAAAAASLIGLPENRIGDLLSCCVQQASGSWQWLLDVEHIEKALVFAGMGARHGLEAALLVEAGFRGVRDSLDAPGGWMMSDAFKGGDVNRRYLIDQLGARSELSETGFKRYPVGGPTQPAVEGLLKLLPQLDRNALQSVQIAMPGSWQSFRDAAMPALNLRYLAAIILQDGRLDFTSAQSLDRMADDGRVRAFMDHVEVVHDAAQEAALGEARRESARVTVIEAGGKRHEIFVPYVFGYPSHPMSRADVETKALELMTPHLGASRSREVVKQAGDVDAVKSGGRLAALIAS
jgi:2-methylcitrate dehydratase PrpD